MNREDVVRMAREANFYDSEIGNNEDGFVHFATLVAAAKEAEINDGLTIAYMDGYEKGKEAGAAAEREACAEKTGEFARKWWSIHCDSNKHMETTRKAHDDFCALQAAIRARGRA